MDVLPNILILLIMEIYMKNIYEIIVIWNWNWKKDKIELHCGFKFLYDNLNFCILSHSSAIYLPIRFTVCKHEYWVSDAK